MHRTQIIRCQLLAIGKFHIGLVHNNRAIYISENFFHSRQAVIIAGRIIRIADNQQRRLLLLTKADNAISIHKAFGCQRIAHLLAVGKGSVLAVHRKRRPWYGNLFARSAKNIAGLFQQLTGAVADFHTIDIYIKLFGNNLTQVFRFNRRITVKRKACGTLGNFFRNLLRQWVIAFVGVNNNIRSHAFYGIFLHRLNTLANSKTTHFLPPYLPTRLRIALA